MGFPIQAQCAPYCWTGVAVCCCPWHLALRIVHLTECSTHLVLVDNGILDRQDLHFAAIDPVDFDLAERFRH